MRIFYILIGAMLLLSNNSIAQVSQGGLPFSNGKGLLKSVSSVNVIDIEKPNIDSVLNQVQYSEKKKDIAAIAVSVDVDILKRGISWEYEGSKVFELALRSPDASGLIVHFSEFSLPDGAKVFVYNDNTVLGAYTSDNNKSFGSFTLQEIKGSEATIQLFIPEGKKDKVKLTVGNVGYGFNKSTAAGDGGPFLFGRSLPCNHGINSKMGAFHQKEKNAVVTVIHLEFTLYIRYTAVLVNTYKQDGTPYFLTARHCFEKVFSNREFHPEYAETAVAHFNYESLAEGENGEWNHSISGAEILCADPTEESGSYAYDLVLLKFSEAPSEEFEPYYAGVKSIEPEIKDIQQNQHLVQGNINFSAVHHPKGDVKKITWYERVQNIDEETISLTDIDGVTEQGSSGSPLFDESHYVIGVLSSGSAGADGNLTCDADVADTYTLLERSKSFVNEINTYLFGDSESRTVEPYEPSVDTSRLVYFPNSIKISHDEETLLCTNKSTENYSNFRWDFGTGAEPQTFTGAEPPAVKLLELGYYKVSLTAYNSTTGQDETFVADSIIQCRYGKAYPNFVVSNILSDVKTAKFENLSQFQYDDTLYVYNNSYGEADVYIYTISVGEKTLRFETTQKEEIVRIPPFESSVLETQSQLYFGRQFEICLEQKHPEKDIICTKAMMVYEPTVAAFDYKRINHFGREMPDDYYMVNETSFNADNKSTGYDIRSKWYVNGEVKQEGKITDFSWMGTEPGFYEMKLVVSNSFSSDSKSVSFEYHLTVGVDDIDDSKLQVYPTLCHDKITIQSPLESMQLNIFDITGKLIQQQELYAGQEIINISSLNSGIYLFNFNSNKRKRTIKIIKQ